MSHFDGDMFERTSQDMTQTHLALITQRPPPALLANATRMLRRMNHLWGLCECQGGVFADMC